MRTWQELVAFARGTRPRPPPGPSQPFVTVLLACAAILHLPIVYVLVGAIDLWPAFTIVVGLLAMGLTWSSGVSLEGRRIGTVRAIAAAGVAEAALAFAPVVGDALGPMRWVLLVTGALCGVALVRLSRSASRPA